MLLTEIWNKRFPLEIHSVPSIRAHFGVVVFLFLLRFFIHKILIQFWSGSNNYIIVNFSVCLFFTFQFLYIFILFLFFCPVIHCMCVMCMICYCYHIIVFVFCYFVKFSFQYFHVCIQFFARFTYFSFFPLLICFPLSCSAFIYRWNFVFLMVLIFGCTKIHQYLYALGFLLFLFYNLLPLLRKHK